MPGMTPKSLHDEERQRQHHGNRRLLSLSAEQCKAKSGNEGAPGTRQDATYFCQVLFGTGYFFPLVLAVRVLLAPSAGNDNELYAQRLKSVLACLT